MLTRHIAGRIYNYQYSVGHNVDFTGHGFGRPLDFVLGPNRTVYVVNRGNEFMPSMGPIKATLDHEFIWQNRGFTYANGESPWPTSIDLDSDENLYVSDDHVSRIFISDKDGNYLRSWGTKGSGDGEMDSPSGIAFDKDENLYVVEAMNNRVQKFTKDGKFLGKWGRHGSGEGEFNMPWGIGIDKQGDIYVADWKNDRVQKFTPEGKYLATFGRSGTGEGELERPTGVAIDQEGDVYVTDWRNHRLKIYAADGTFITDFIGDSEKLDPSGQAVVDANPDVQKARRRTDLSPEWRFNRPVAVNVDDEGRIMVLETQRGRIQIYIKERDFVEAPYFI